MTVNPKKIALITGATKGIGLETARQLAAHGIHVVLTGRDGTLANKIATEMRETGLSVEAWTLDITKPEMAAMLAKEIDAKYGRLDILVNNAAIRVEEYGKEPSEQPLEQWRQTFETNLFGAVTVTQVFLPLLQKSKAGRIVNVSSLLGSLSVHSDPASYSYSEKFKSLPGYSASKSALNSWTVHLAYELRNTKIKVNAVHPGYTKTDLNCGEGDFDVEAGAKTSVIMALLEDNGATGTYVHMENTVPW